MSEKQVNIKITASTKDFDNAIKKAQKQIEGLADAIDSLGSSKFGDKLEEKFDSLIKAAKKTEEQITDMLDSLDELGKTKLNKVEDELEDVSKAGEKLNETLEDTSDSINDIDKSKFSKLEDQFKDIVDSGKDFNEKVEDIIDLLDKVDRQDLNGLEDEFDQVRDALDKISKETKNSTEAMETSFREVTDEVNRFIRELNNIEDTKLENLEESIKDIDKYIDEAAESFSDFNKQTNDLDNKELNDFLDSVIDITRAGEDAQDALKKAFGSLDGKNGKIDLNISGKGKDGILSDIADGFISGTVAGNKLEKAMDGVVDRLDDVVDNMKKLDDATDDSAKSIDDWGEEYKEAENALKKLGEEYEKHNKELEESSKIYNELKTVIDDYEKEERELVDTCNKANDAMKEHKAKIEDVIKFQEKWNNQSAELRKQIADNAKALDELNKEYDENGAKCEAAEDKCAELSKTLNELKKRYEEAARGALALDKAGDEAGAERLAEEWDRLGKEIEDVKKQLKEAEDAYDAFDNEGYDIWGRIEALEKEKEALQELYEIRKKTVKEMEARDGSSMKDTFAEMKEELKKLEKEAEDAKKAFNDLGDSVKAEEYTQAQVALWAYGRDIGKTVKNLEQLNDVMNDHKKVMAETNKVAQGHADDFDKQYKAYEKLSQKVKAYLEDEENGILLREKVAKSFKDVADSMEAVYKGASKNNNADLINKTLKEAAEYVKELDLVSTENLQADLERLGEIIEDKTEKIKRFKELNKDFGSDASKQAYGLEKQAQAIRDWANSADFAIEAADTLTHAWGDLSAAGEDHLKIRNRSKYIEDYGKALEENVTHIKNYYHELETLDEIYKECTSEQRAIIDDYKIWEKNKDKLLEYNKAIKEYLRTVNDSGGQIDTKFLDELGKFDPQKFIDGYEKMGASSVVLSKQINAVKIELLESIKQFKEHTEAMKEDAKAAAERAEETLKQAKADQKAAESQEDYLEATERVKKAQEDLAKAKEKVKHFDKEQLEGLRDQIKEYNRLAEAMREIGMAANDLGKADIAKFDSSLASMLDRLGTFENDIPKTFAGLKEDIMAVFSDLDTLDLSGVFDGLKDIGAGIFAALPTEIKATAAAVAALTFALKECAEEGVQQFTRGMDTLKGAISGIAGVARDIGQEIYDAFENITGMQLDMSSLLEIPVNFESQMARVGAIAGVTEEEFDELEAKARELGATTRYSATEVAEAMEYMGMAGWTNKEILAGLGGVLNLATVANMDLGQASDFVTDALTALGMEAGEAGDMVDMLATISTKTNTSVAQMQRAFTNVAPVAGTLNITMKDLSMALGLMADKGVKGAKAGTALKNLLANLSAPTEKQLEYIKEFNLQGAQQDIVQGRLIDGIKKMKTALGPLSEQQKLAVITAIAGKEALSGVSALLGTTEEDLAKLEAAMSDCNGAADEMAKNFNQTLKGALDDLASGIEETLLQVFDKVEGGIKKVVGELNEFFNILNGFSELKDENGNKLTGLADALAYLEEVSQGWGDAIADGLHNAINAIDDFVNSKSFDNILQIGTNIINGIADGIKRAAKDGSLDSAISTAIRKIANWFSENLDTIVEVGKEIIDAISKGISENHAEIGKAVKAVIEMQTEIDKAVAREKWKLIGDNLVTFIIEGIESKVSVFVAALSGFFSTGVTEALGKVADIVTSTGSTLFFDPIMKLGKWIGELLRDAILEFFNIDFDLGDIFSGFSFDGFSFGNKDKKKDKSNKKSNSSNKGKKDSSSGSGWANFKKELESWGKGIKDWGVDVSGKLEEAWIGIYDSFSDGGEKTSKSVSISWSDVEKELSNWGNSISTWGTNIGNDISDAWTSIKGTLDSWDKGISDWASNTSTWFSNSWSGAKEELSQWKTGIAEWGTETGEELSKVGNNIKIFFTETLPSYLDPEKLGSALGTLTGTIAKGVADGWTALDEWGNELYVKGSEAAIKYSDGIRDFFIELPDKISTWLTDAWTAVDTWGENLYIKGSEAAIKYSNGIRDFFIELPSKISTWLTNAWSAVDAWGNNLYTKGSEAAIKYSNGIRDYFAELYNNISTWLTNAWKAVDEWGTNLYTKGSEAAIKYSDGIRDFFVQLPGKITTWLSNATKSFTKWCKELYTKGKEAINNLAKGISEGLRQLPSKITAGLSSGKKAVTTWGNDVKKSASSAGKNIVNGIFSGMNGFKSAITSWCSRFKSSFVSSFKKAFGIHSPSTVMRDEVGVNLALGIEEGLNSGAGNIAQTAGNIVSSVKNGLGDIWSNIFSGNISSTDLVNISAEGIDQAGMALRSLSVTLMETSEAVDQAGMAFKSFSMTLAQMSETLQVNNKEFMSLGASFANVSEITNAIRTAFMSIANIINNQVTNARNALTSQFLSMAAVARTQMVNISNIVRNQAIAWNNIIANQAKNARDNFTRQFMSMAAVCRTQMNKCLSSVKSVMSQISSATNKKMSMNVNVNRSVSTSYAMPSANALYAANNASTFSLGGNTGALAYGASYAMSTGGGITSNGGGMSDGTIIEVPLYLDGREVARATAKYVDSELKLMTKRENRKRGAK